MVKAHLKRISLPRTWSVPRKSFQKEKFTFISRPNPGKFFELAVSLNTFLKELTKVAQTKKEVKSLLQFKTVTVNGVRARDEKFPIGLFDVVGLEDAKEYYRLTLSEFGKIAAVSIDAKEKSTIIRKVDGKTLLKGGKVQLNLSSSENLLVEKSKEAVGDVLVLTDKKVKTVLPLKKDMTVLIIAGKYIGTIAKVTSVEDSKIFIDADGQKVETLKKYAFVVGEKAPEITLRT